MSTAPSRLLLRFAVTATLMVSAPLAGAQTITLQPAGTFYRNQPLRPTGQQPHWVNQADCLANDVIRFPVSMTGYLGYTLQVWAGNQGTDCTQVNARQAGGSSTCWLLYSEAATATPTTVDISAVQLVQRKTPDTKDVLPFPDICFAADPPTGQALSLYFMFISSGTTVVGSPQIWNDIGYDVIAPDPPTGVTGAPGETRIHLNWTQASSPDVRSYRLYCAAAPGSIVPDGGLSTTAAPLGTLALGSGGFDTGAGGAFGTGGSLFGTGGSLFGTGGSLFGTGGDLGSGGAGGSSVVGGTGGTQDGGTAGSGAGGASTAVSCSAASAIQPGVSPEATDLSRYACGSVTGITASSATAGNLANNVPYVVAVSAVDQVGNIGVLSQNVCQTPIEVTDFFELYRSAGGKAGGGICSMSFASNPARSGIILLGGVLALAGAVRRNRRRRK